MIEINLLPWREQQKRLVQIKQGLEAGAAALLAFLLLLIFHFIQEAQLQSAEARLIPIRESLAETNQRLTALRQVYQELNYQALPDGDVNRIFAHQKHLLDLLRAVASKLPRALYARQMSLEGNTFRIEGVATVLSEILRFEEALKNGLTGEKIKIGRKNSLFHYQLRLDVGL